MAALDHGRITHALADLRAKAEFAGEDSDWVRVCDIATAAEHIRRDGHSVATMDDALNALDAALARLAQGREAEGE